MQILHVSAECFPVLKAGGLGDVVGSLPKYQAQDEHDVRVIVPFHDSKFVLSHTWDVVYEKNHIFGHAEHWVRIWKQADNSLGYSLCLVEVPGMFPREKVYGYHDDTQRFIFFQIIVMNWIAQLEERPDVIHCHDHTTGLIPFLLKYGSQYAFMQHIPSVFTIHNGEYQGQFPWHLSELLPHYDPTHAGFLDHNGLINPLISAVKNAWAVTTVSEGYMSELLNESSALGESLRNEGGKTHGIINGIDTLEWSPKTDAFLNHHYTHETVDEGKRKNKEELCASYGFDPALPLFVFVGRMVHEKGADYMFEGLGRVLNDDKKANFLIIGSGQPELEQAAEQLKYFFPQNYNTYIGYNEGLARLAYAAADFLLMPSRVEPCGLNQMYSMHYGTIPIVRKIGGLKDTVRDIGDGGEGFTFLNPDYYDFSNAVLRALHYKMTKVKWKKHRQRLMQLDFSWDNSAKKYIELYKTLLS